jgi:membrane protein implicated in regulation of membrane protease activity
VIVEFNSKGKLARFYMWLPPDDKKLPDDFCTYFWGLAGRAFFVFGFCGTLLLMLIAGLVFAVARASTWMWAHKGGTLFFLSVILFSILIVWLSERKTKIKIEMLSETKAIIRGKVDAVKNRYCPRIEWK